MPELSQETINSILVDIRNDAIKVQQMVDQGIMTPKAHVPDYQALDMLHYVVKTLESRVRILRGYN